MFPIYTTTKGLEEFLKTTFGKGVRGLVKEAIKRGLVIVVPDNVTPGPGGDYEEFPDRAVTCLFMPSGPGNRTTWDPLERPMMWDWLRSIGANCVVMLACRPGEKRMYSESELIAVAAKCREYKLFPFWTVFSDGSDGYVDNRKWKENYDRTTGWLIAALDKNRIPGGIVFSIEHNEQVSPSEVTAWARFTRNKTSRKLCAHMEMRASVPGGLDVVFAETNQPTGGRGDAMTVDQFMAKARAAKASIEAAGARCMVHEYNENVGGSRYREQRAALSKLSMWGYA